MQQLYHFKSKSTTLLPDNIISGRYTNQKKNNYFANQQHIINNQNRYYNVKNKNNSNYPQQTLNLSSKFKRSLNKLHQRIFTIDKWKQKYTSQQYQMVQSPHKKLPPIKTHRHLDRQINHNEQQQKIRKDLAIVKVKISKTISTDKNKNYLKNQKDILLGFNRNHKIQLQIKQFKKKSQQKMKQQDNLLKNSQNSKHSLIQNEKQIEKKQQHQKYNMMLSRILQGKPQRWQSQYQDGNQIQNIQNLKNIQKI